MVQDLLAANDVVVAEAQSQAAIDALQKASDFRTLKFAILDDHGSRIDLPIDLNRLFESVLQVVAQRGRVTVTSLPSQLTSSAAARMLGISRPTLMKYVRAGEIPVTYEKSHARFKTEDLSAFAAARQVIRKAAFRDLRDLTADLVLE